MAVRFIVLFWLVYILIMPFSYSQNFPKQDSNKNIEKVNKTKAEGVDIPVGMELRKFGNKNIIVPKGAKIHKSGNRLIIEGASEYAARNFLYIKSRITKVELEYNNLKKELKSLKAFLNDSMEQLKKVENKQREILDKASKKR